MTEFKQIVGRGTRVHEDTGKFYFTLIDFRGAKNHFADPDYDGEPVQIYAPGPGDPVDPPEPDDAEDEDGDSEGGAGEDSGGGDADPTRPVLVPGAVGNAGPQRKIYVDGIGARIVAERVEYLDEHGKLVTESLRDYTKRALQQRFVSLDAFLRRWNAAERKQAVLEELAAEGLPLDILVEELGRDLDPFDLICHAGLRCEAAAHPPRAGRRCAQAGRVHEIWSTRRAPCSTRC